MATDLDNQIKIINEYISRFDNYILRANKLNRNSTTFSVVVFIIGCIGSIVTYILAKDTATVVPIVVAVFALVSAFPSKDYFHHKNNISRYIDLRKICLRLQNELRTYKSKSGHALLNAKELEGTQISEYSSLNAKELQRIQIIEEEFERIKAFYWDLEKK